MCASHPQALLTPEQMALVDTGAVHYGISEETLMEAAGRAVATTVARQWSKRVVVVLCGPGNNGGDGLVAARYLRSWGWTVRVGLLCTPDRLSGVPAAQLMLWNAPIVPFSVELLDEAELLVDAVFGAGLSRPLEEPAKGLFEEAVRKRLPVCAVDVPSGVDGATGCLLGPVLRASHTVTFVRKKPGHVLMPGKEMCGQIHLADIGVPVAVLQQVEAAAIENHPSLWFDQYPRPEMASHKYRRGHVLLAGGATMTGAARLSAISAARIGAGVVTLAVPAAVWPVYAASLLSVLVQPLEAVADWDALLDDERRNVVVVGPGAGISEQTRQQVLAALIRQRGVVLDADAISSFENQSDILFSAINGTCVLTPHEGEFARLFPALSSNEYGSKLERTREAARRSKAVVVLKGADTVIAAPDGRAIINANAPATLATAGSGDVLAGLIAGLLAQGMEPFFAAAAAVWLHGAAASLFGPGLVADDLPDILPRVLRQLQSIEQ